MRRYSVTDCTPFLGLPYQSQTITEAVSPRSRLGPGPQGWFLFRASLASGGLPAILGILWLVDIPLQSLPSSSQDSPWVCICVQISSFKRTQPSHIGLGATILQHDLNKLHLQRPTATWGHILRFWGLDFNIRICREGHYSTHDRYQLCNEGPEQRKEWGPRP